jgi:hypothetical protein
MRVAVIALVLVLVAICGFEPIQGDGWGHYFNAREPLTWDRFLAVARGYHDHGNPRWGQLVLVLSYHHAIVALVISPLAITGMLLAALTLARGRWPDRGDGWLFVGIVAAALLTTPSFGEVWFHRPVCTNYIYPLALQLAWLVPYRFLSLRPARCSLFAIIPLGVLAGAGNEHTGPGLVVAAVACAVIAWRRDRRVPVWAITGIASVVLGNVMLLTAPGQQARYGGLAASQSWLSPLVERGIVGSCDVLVVQLLWSIPMLAVVAVAARAAGWPRLSTTTMRTAGGCLVVAGCFLATALLSPKLPLRLLAAPAMMIVIAFAIVMIDLAREARAARQLNRACATLAAVVLTCTLVVTVITGLEGRARVARLEAAAPGSTVRVTPYTFARLRLVSYGDDFRNVGLVEDIARRLGLASILWR